MTEQRTAQTDAPDSVIDDLMPRAIDTYSRHRGLDTKARRALLDAVQDLTLCFIAAWNTMRADGTTAEKVFADLSQTRFQLVEVREWAEILTACRADMDPHRRNHFTPALRFQILEHMRKNMLSIEQTAQRFVVSGQTIRNWLDELSRDPAATAIGKPLLDPHPPVQRFADGVRRLIHLMSDAGIGGKKKIAETLMRLGWKADPRTVGRIVREPRRPNPPPTPPAAPRPTTTVRGDYPNHLVIIDITRIPLLFPFLYVHLAIVLDAFSRLPLAATIRFLEPSAADTIGLFQRAIRLHGRPRHLVVDQGSQFTSGAFKAFVKTHKIHMRYGKVGEFHSISLVDRFFRTLKESLGVPRRRPWDFRGVADFKRRLDLALVHYSYVRPHAALGGLTPVEKYYGIREHLPQPVQPPRGRAGDPDIGDPFDVVFLDPDNNDFPIVIPEKVA